MAARDVSNRLQRLLLSVDQNLSSLSEDERDGLLHVGVCPPDFPSSPHIHLVTSLILSA